MGWDGELGREEGKERKGRELREEKERFSFDLLVGLKLRDESGIRAGAPKMHLRIWAQEVHLPCPLSGNLGGYQLTDQPTEANYEDGAHIRISE